MMLFRALRLWMVLNAAFLALCCVANYPLLGLERLIDKGFASEVEPEPPNSAYPCSFDIGRRCVETPKATSFADIPTSYISQAAQRQSSEAQIIESLLTDGFRHNDVYVGLHTSWSAGILVTIIENTFQLVWKYRGQSFSIFVILSVLFVSYSLRQYRLARWQSAGIVCLTMTFGGFMFGSDYILVSMNRFAAKHIYPMLDELEFSQNVEWQRHKGRFRP